jgi:hypothetical protein
VRSEVPEYFIEIECHRLIRERENEVPRRGSKRYHEAMERLRPEASEAYFQNHALYDGGHLWCPECGARLGEPAN